MKTDTHKQTHTYKCFWLVAPWVHTCFVCDPNTKKTEGLCCLAGALESPAVFCPDWVLFSGGQRVAMADIYESNMFVCAYADNKCTLGIRHRSVFLSFSLYHTNTRTDTMWQRCSSPVSAYTTRQMVVCFTVHPHPDWFIYLSVLVPSLFVWTPSCSELSQPLRLPPSLFVGSACWHFLFCFFVLFYCNWLFPIF